MINKVTKTDLNRLIVAAMYYGTVQYDSDSNEARDKMYAIRTSILKKVDSMENDYLYSELMRGQ